MLNNDMPERGFNYVEGADVSFLDLIVPAEPVPAWPEVAHILVRETSHLPRTGALQWGLEGDCATFAEANRITESHRQSLQK